MSRSSRLWPSGGALTTLEISPSVDNRPVIRHVRACVRARSWWCARVASLRQSVHSDEWPQATGPLKAAVAHAASEAGTHSRPRPCARTTRIKRLVGIKPMADKSYDRWHPSNFALLTQNRVILVPSSRLMRKWSFVFQVFLDIQDSSLQGSCCRNRTLNTLGCLDRVIPVLFGIAWGWTESEIEPIFTKAYGLKLCWWILFIKTVPFLFN